MDLKENASPTKRARIEQACKFVASPRRVLKDEAINLKRSDARHYELRYISSNAISTKAAAGEAPKGYEVCISPKDTHTNNQIDALRQEVEFDAMKLYMRALFSTMPMCALDLTMVIVYILDYHSRRLYLSMKKQANDPAKFQSLYVGKGKSKPFKTTSGDGIKYIHLLKSYFRLVDPDWNEDGDDVQLRKEEYARFLTCVEENTARSAGQVGVDLQSNQIREEVAALYMGEEKKARDHGPHVFTKLFWQEPRTPLEKQHLEDELPPENYEVFSENGSSDPKCIGLKVLALQDLMSAYAACGTPSSLQTPAPMLTHAAGMVVKAYIRLKAKDVDYNSVEFRYGSLRASLGTGQPTQVMDLSTVHV